MKIKNILISILIILLSMTLKAAEKTSNKVKNLIELKLDIQKLATNLGDFKAHAEINGKKSLFSSVSLRSYIYGNKAKIQMQETSQNGAKVYTYSEYFTDLLLHSSEKIIAKTEKVGRHTSVDTSINKGKETVRTLTVNGNIQNTSVKEWQKDLFSLHALSFVVTLLPKKIGTDYSYQSAETISETNTISCTKKVDLNGKNCFVFEMTKSKQKEPFAVYWVSEDDQLQKYTLQLTKLTKLILLKDQDKL